MAETEGKKEKGTAEKGTAEKGIWRYVNNFYFWTAVIFLSWMLLFDSNDWMSRYRMKQKLRVLEQEKSFYEEEISEIKESQKALKSDKRLLEKMAREKYLLRRDNEDVYIIEKKEIKKNEAAIKSPVSQDN